MLDKERLEPGPKDQGVLTAPKSISTAALVLAGEGGVVGPRGSRHVEGARSASV